jgi:alpha-tubulin suppressor-like RCC1 family protein
MGDNENGQLGDSTTNNVNQPKQIVLSNVVAIAAGFSHSLFLKADGSLWAMGYNGSGQLGDGTSNDSNIPKQIIATGIAQIVSENSHNLLLKSDGSLWGMGYNYYGQLGDGFPTSNSALPEQIFPSPRPVLTNSISSATNLQFNAACQFGGTFYLLAGTNLTQSLSQWTPVATNVINYRFNNLFSATLTNAVNSSAGQQFYILQSQ